MIVEFPTGRIFARQNNVVKCTQSFEDEAGAVTLTISGISSSRYFSGGSGVQTLYFPIDQILEYLLGSNNSKLIATNAMAVDWSGEFAGVVKNSQAILIVNGASKRAFDALPSAGLSIGFPQPKDARIYPSLLPHSFPCCSKNTISYLTVTNPEYAYATYDDMFNDENIGAGEISYIQDTGLYYINVSVGVFSLVNGGNVVYSSLSDGNNATLTDAARVFLLNSGSQLCVESSLSALNHNKVSYIIDDCTEGFFVRWLDIYGYTMHFRFTKMDIVEAYKDNKTISTFTSTLSEKKSTQKDWETAYTLTSGLVDKNTFDWIRRIPSGRNIQMFLNNVWEDVQIAETSISGENEMNSINVKLSIENLTPTL